MKHEKGDFSAIKKEIEDFFTAKEMGVRVIYRTCSKKFGGDESPHNLLPKEILKNHVTIYLDFDAYADKESINYLIAFLDEDSDKLPELVNPRLSGDRPKVDLKSIPAKYKFKNITDLFENYFDRFHADR